MKNLIKEDGIVLLEGFSKNNLSIRMKNPRIGGPINIEMFFTKKSIKNDFPNFEIIKL